MSADSTGGPIATLTLERLLWLQLTAPLYPKPKPPTPEFHWRRESGKPNDR